VKEDFNQWQQSWWKLFELTTANPLFFKVLPKLLHWHVLPKKQVCRILPKLLANKNLPVIFLTAKQVVFLQK
jgi:hypothetical protein